ncbi:MAG: hypothetical protein AAGU75_10755, partial [Bacillota bacterium]
MIHDMLTAEEAKSALEFALSRLEMHIDVGFGDGKWSDWLEPYKKPEENVAGLIWAFLGSPNVGVRWDAVHAVKRIARFNGKDLLEHLMNCVKNNSVGCFGYKGFPFYNLNAHLYLLFALNRIAIDEPKQVVPYVQELIDYVNWDIPHALIQRIAINTIRRIQLFFPGLINKDKYKELIAMGESQFPVKIVSCDEYYAAKEKDDEDKRRFFHGYDFERYWFGPLGKIFGVPENFISRYASEVIIDEWKIHNGGGYKQEPRASIFTSRRYEDYYYSHSSRPKLENYQFYLSFHSMFVVAARLLKGKPMVIMQDDDNTDPWFEWIIDYEVTRPDGYLLADARGCIPAETPAWMSSEKGKDWRTGIVAEDYINNIITKDGRLCVDGIWENWQEPYSEEIWVASALVSREASQALMLALMGYKNSHDYKLPDYGEDDWQQDNAPFVLRGWIKSEYSKYGLDDYDIWSGGIRYPNAEPGEDFINCLGLTVNKLSTQWFDNKNELAIECINWSRLRRNKNNVENKIGSKLLVTIETAKALCQKTEMNLIIEVQINRRIMESYYHDVKKDDGYRPPAHMIYLFTEEGVLIDENGIVNFGKKNN